MNKRFAMLLFAAISFCIYFVIANISQLHPIKYSIDQFYVLWHESGHSLVAVLTGGWVKELVTLPGIGGYAAIAGGNSAFFLPAGYCGAALVGSVMFYITNCYPKYDDFVSYIYGIVVIMISSIFWTSDPILRFITIVFSIFAIMLLTLTRSASIKWMIGFLLVPIAAAVVISQVDRNSSANLTYLAALATGGVLIIFGLSRGELVNTVVLNVFNIALILNAWERVSGLPDATFAGARDDAAQFAAQFGGTPHDVALTWLRICLLFFAISLIATFVHLGKSKKT